MNDQLTFDDLRAYQAGLLNGPARHRVERILLENPFYADALAGLEAMQQTASTLAAGPMTEQMADLRDALHQRIHESATRRRLWPLWIATTTAAILFMLAMAIYFIFFAPKHIKKPQVKPAHAVTNVAPGSPVQQTNVVTYHPGFFVMLTQETSSLTTGIEPTKMLPALTRQK